MDIFYENIEEKLRIQKRVKNRLKEKELNETNEIDLDIEDEENERLYDIPLDVLEEDDFGECHQ